MEPNYLNAIADHGASLITHVGLVNGSGVELSSAGYERQTATWTTADDGNIRLTTDRVFDVAEGDVVAGWRGYSAATDGTNYGGGSLTSTTFNNPGTYTLTGAATGINHDAA